MMIAKINETTRITSIEELINYAKSNYLNSYSGFTDSTDNARLNSSTKHHEEVIIYYDSILDCKKTEVALKNICTTFKPKRYGKFEQIKATKGLKEVINDLKRDNESFEFVIWRLIFEHYDNL